MTKAQKEHGERSTPFSWKSHGRFSEDVTVELTLEEGAEFARWTKFRREFQQRRKQQLKLGRKERASFS